MSTTIGVSPRHLPHPKKQKVSGDIDMRTMPKHEHYFQYDLKWVEELHQPDDGLSALLQSGCWQWSGLPLHGVWPGLCVKAAVQEFLPKPYCVSCQKDARFRSGSQQILLNIESFSLVLRARKPTASWRTKQWRPAIELMKYMKPWGADALSVLAGC